MRPAFFISVLVLGACGHDLDPLRSGLSDGGPDMGVDSGDSATDSAPVDASACGPATCNTALPCHEAICSGDLCVVQPLCGLGEECCAGSCVPAGCSDGVACTTDSCGASGCENVPADAVCDVVTGGTCDPVNGCQYPVCDDTTCVDVGCMLARCEVDVCIRESTCGADQECCAGMCVPTGCDDGNLCTDDSCASSGCVNTDNSADCDDGELCNGPDRCASGTCSDHGPAAANGTMCGATTSVCGACGGFSRACGELGRCIRTRTTRMCMSGVCEDDVQTDTEICSRVTEGLPCPQDGNCNPSTCMGGVCGSSGVCSGICCEPGRCTPSGRKCP